MNQKLLQIARNHATLVCEKREEKWDNFVWEAEFAKRILTMCIAELEAAKQADPYTGEEIPGTVNDVLQAEIDNLKWIWDFK